MVEATRNTTDETDLSGEQRSRTVSLNIDILPIGKPTINGHIYTTKVMTDAIDEFFSGKKKHIDIVNKLWEQDPSIILFINVVGLVTKENLVMTKKHLKLKSFSPMGEAGKALANLLEQKAIVIAPFGSGTIGDNGHVKEYKLYGLQVAINQQ